MKIISNWYNKYLGKVISKPNPQMIVNASKELIFKDYNSYKDGVKLGYQIIDILEQEFTKVNIYEIYYLILIIKIQNNFNKHLWFSGRIRAYQAREPGSIPGGCKHIFLFSLLILNMSPRGGQ